MCLLVATAAAGKGTAELTLMSYNVQNLFDGKLDGTEYAEFTPAGGWTVEAYLARLRRLEEVLRSVPGGLPGLIVFQEMESASVAEDLTRDHLRGRWHLSAGPDGVGATQVVVASRAQPVEVRIHRVAEYAAGRLERPLWQGRDMVEVVLPFGAGSLRLFACHWKSQRGGEEATEVYRLREATALLTRIAAAGRAPGESLLVVGDLNEDLEEYLQHDRRYLTAIMPARDAPPDGPPLPLVFVESVREAVWDPEAPRFATLWTGVEFPGTYSYRGTWERLDHIFLLPAPDVEPAGPLEVLIHPWLLNSADEPYRYDTRTRTGYSDHLPILARLTTRRVP